MKGMKLRLLAIGSIVVVIGIANIVIRGSSVAILGVTGVGALLLLGGLLWK